MEPRTQQKNTGPTDLLADQEKDGIGQSRFTSCDNTTDAEVLDELRWHPTELLLLKRTPESSRKAVAASSGKRFAELQSEQWEHFWTT